jgi:hypothetical protein
MVISNSESRVNPIPASALSRQSDFMAFLECRMSLFISLTPVHLENGIGRDCRKGVYRIDADWLFV